MYTHTFAGVLRAFKLINTYLYVCMYVGIEGICDRRANLRWCAGALLEAFLDNLQAGVC